MFSEPNGYCIFNNAAIAVRHALDILGLDRILLVDWDVHHGQGSQYAFYDDPRYVSWSSAAYNSYSFAIFFLFYYGNVLTVHTTTTTTTTTKL